MDRVRKRIQLDGLEEKHWQKYNVNVAVLDTGITSHPDLLGKCLIFKDFVNHKERPYDDNGHGTHVCGIICGSGEASGGKYRGIAPSCRLVVCKVLDKKGDGSANTMIQALEWIWKNHKRYNIRIINISVGIGKMNDKHKYNIMTEYLDKLWNSGIVIICAAGNKGPRPGSLSNIGGNNNVITIGCYDDLEAVYSGENCMKYSGRGSKMLSYRKPDLVAPGTGIVSCNNLYREEPYIAKNGTSMATPIVSGSAALLLQKYPYLSNNTVKERLQFSAQDLGKPWNWQGWGMVNVKNLLEIN